MGRGQSREAWQGRDAAAKACSWHSGVPVDCETVASLWKGVLAPQSGRERERERKGWTMVTAQQQADPWQQLNRLSLVYKTPLKFCLQEQEAAGKRTARLPICRTRGVFSVCGRLLVCLARTHGIRQANLTPWLLPSSRQRSKQSLPTPRALRPSGVVGEGEEKRKPPDRQGDCSLAHEEPSCRRFLGLEFNPLPPPPPEKETVSRPERKTG